MIKNEDIICFSSIDWDFNWQGHQEIMQTLAANGNRVLFIENTGVRTPRLRDYERLLVRVRNWWRGFKGIRQLGDNLYVFSPILFPFPYSRPARWINKRIILRIIRSWCVSMRFSNPLIWSFLPSPLTLEVIKAIPGKLIIYYCIDSFEHSSLPARRIRQYEERMIRMADLVFVTSEGLRQHCLAHNREVYKFPFTVNIERFDRVRGSGEIPLPDDLKNVPKPIVGYLGGLHRWVDQPLAAELARLLPECRFVYVGPEQEPMALLQGLDNVHLLGEKPHDQLPFYLAHFDVGLIPYRLTDYTDNVYPTKLNEYLAMGLPVVSTPIREVVLFEKEHPGMVELCGQPEEMAAVIRESLKKAGQEQEAARRAARVELARENSWSGRIERMSGLILDKIAQTKSSKDMKWKSRLARTLAVTRKRVLAAALIVLALYGALEWTPLVYLVGRPLKTQTERVRADVILVFGGGVGETGRPGRSTMERARLAARLYQQNLAGKILFSSGFQQYNNNDAEDMSKWARAEGVPPQDLLIEDRAANNYENVLFCLKEMERLGYTSALVVTSPYNLLRSRLIFRKQLELASGTKITENSIHLVPVENDIFFNPAEGGRVEQLRAILHEYAAIVYYWWLGRI